MAYKGVTLLIWLLCMRRGIVEPRNDLCIEAGRTQELVTNIIGDLPHLWMYLYTTVGVNLGSLNYIVCAEHLTDNGMLVAVAGVQLYSWFSIMWLNGRPAADIKSFFTEDTPALDTGCKLKWIEKKPRGMTKPLMQRSPLVKRVMAALMWMGLAYGLLRGIDLVVDYLN
jgi:hypothetical protein